MAAPIGRDPALVLYTDSLRHKRFAGKGQSISAALAATSCRPQRVSGGVGAGRGGLDPSYGLAALPLKNFRPMAALKLVQGLSLGAVK